MLVDRKVPFPKTHAIMDLLTLLQQNGVDIPQGIQQAGVLTVYAVKTRYPGVSEEVTAEDYAASLALAERTVLWAQSLIRTA